MQTAFLLLLDAWKWVISQVAGTQHSIIRAEQLFFYLLITNST